MMLLHLVKKDFLLIKKSICFIILMGEGVALFVALRAPVLGGGISLLYTVILSELVACHSVSFEEAKYPKAAALLCSAPYKRSTLVRAKYVFSLVVFSYCYIAYTLAALFIPGVHAVGLTAVLSVLLFSVIMIGVYLPVYLKFGSEYAKYLYLIMIFLPSFAAPLLYQYLSTADIDFSVIADIPAAIINTALVFANIGVFSFSMLLSEKIFAKKDL